MQTDEVACVGNDLFVTINANQSNTKAEKLKDARMTGVYIRSSRNTVVMVVEAYLLYRKSLLVCSDNLPFSSYHE